MPFQTGEVFLKVRSTSTHVVFQIQAFLIVLAVNDLSHELPPRSVWCQHPCPGGRAASACTKNIFLIYFSQTKCREKSRCSSEWRTGIASASVGKRHRRCSKTPPCPSCAATPGLSAHGCSVSRTIARGFRSSIRCRTFANASSRRANTRRRRSR